MMRRAIPPHSILFGSSLRGRVNLKKDKPSLVGKCPISTLFPLYTRYPRIHQAITKYDPAIAQMNETTLVKGILNIYTRVFELRCQT